MTISFTDIAFDCGNRFVSGHCLDRPDHEYSLNLYYAVGGQHHVRAIRWMGCNWSLVIDAVHLSNRDVYGGILNDVRMQIGLYLSPPNCTSPIERGELIDTAELGDWVVLKQRRNVLTCQFLRNNLFATKYTYKTGVDLTKIPDWVRQEWFAN